MNMAAHAPVGLSTDGNDELGRMLTTAARLLPGAQQLLRVHDSSAGPGGMLGLSQPPQARDPIRILWSLRFPSNVCTVASQCDDGMLLRREEAAACRSCRLESSRN
jgi:hypothetical protein